MDGQSLDEDDDKKVQVPAGNCATTHQDIITLTLVMKAVQYFVNERIASPYQTVHSSPGIMSKGYAHTNHRKTVIHTFCLAADAKACISTVD